MVITKVTDTIYLGDWQDARDLITRNYILFDIRTKMIIMTCAFDSPYHGNYFFPIVDGPGDDKAGISKEASYQSFLDAVNKLKELQTANIPTLVHCMSGRSRSVSVVVKYLMQYKGLNYDSAVYMITSQGREIGINQYFQEVLKQ